MKRRWTIRGFFIALLLLCVGGVLWVWHSTSNYLTVRNSSSGAVDNVRVTIRSTDGHKMISRNFHLLPSGDELVIRHNMRDSRVEIAFSHAGTEYKFAQPYIDLWTGEGWVIDVQPDLSIKSGYTSAQVTSK